MVSSKWHGSPPPTISCNAVCYAPILHKNKQIKVVHLHYLQWQLAVARQSEETPQEEVSSWKPIETQRRLYMEPLVGQGVKGSGVFITSRLLHKLTLAVYNTHLWDYLVRGPKVELVSINLVPRKKWSKNSLKWASLENYSHQQTQKIFVYKYFMSTCTMCKHWHEILQPEIVDSTMEMIRRGRPYHNCNDPTPKVHSMYDSGSC